MERLQLIQNHFTQESPLFSVSEMSALLNGKNPHYKEDVTFILIQIFFLKKKKYKINLK